MPDKSCSCISNSYAILYGIYKYICDYTHQHNNLIEHAFDNQKEVSPAVELTDIGGCS